jgi:hypothetical protein
MIESLLLLVRPPNSPRVFQTNDRHGAIYYSTQMMLFTLPTQFDPLIFHYHSLQTDWTRLDRHMPLRDSWRLLLVDYGEFWNDWTN